MSDVLSDIGMRLKRWRKENRFTQAETAKLLEMSLNFYGDIERGKCRLSIEKIILAHQRLGIDPTYLLTGEEYQPVGFYDIIKDCPKDKIFDMEQIMILSILLYTIFSKKTSFLDRHQYSLRFAL